MNWKEAELLIKNAMLKGTEINTPNSKERQIIAVNVPLNSYDYDKSLGFQVKIGEKVTIDIPWFMLESCFRQLSTQSGYNSEYFKNAYSKQKENHGCHVHVIGQIFVKAGIAEARGNLRSPSYFLIEH